MENQLEIEIKMKTKDRGRERQRTEQQTEFGKAFVGNFKFSATITKARENFPIFISMEKPIGIALRC